MSHTTNPPQVTLGPWPGTDADPDLILRPGDAAYREAVTTMLGIGTPELVVRPRSADQVVDAVRRARTLNLPLTVRAGGHSLAAASTVSAGLLLDLRRMHTIEVDPTTHVVRIGGGACWGRVAQALAPHGLGLTAGDTAGVGVGGLTLGGGIGWMVRRHGLAIDSLVGVQLVTPDGQLLEVSAHQHPDLFWAVRGGGPGLGVVTRFDFVAHEVRDVVFGRLTVQLEDPAATLAAWRDVQLGADERLTTTITVPPATGDQPPMAIVAVCFAGPEDEAAPLIDRLRRIGGTLLGDDVGVRPYAEILDEESHGADDGETDAHPAAGIQLTARNALLPALGDQVIADLAALTRAPGSVVSVRALGGAFSRVPEHATAFSGRSAQAMVVVLRMTPVDPDAAAVPGEIAAPGDIEGWDRLARHGRGAYRNFLSELPAHAEAS